MKASKNGRMSIVKFVTWDLRKARSIVELSFIMFHQ